MIKYHIEGYSVINDGDRGDTSIVIGYFKHEADAKLAAKGNGFYGGDASVSKYDKTIIVFENLEEYNKNLKSDLRAKALAKLDKDERELLGLESI